MGRKSLVLMLSLFFLFLTTPLFAFADNTEIAGVKFPNERIIEGKVLKLNGVSVLKKFGFLEVYAVGLYLEKPTNDSNEIINSDQVKYLHTQYLTSKATEKKIRNGFIELITNCNNLELVNSNKKNIDKFSSWIDGDMSPGLSSETIYVPGHGLTLIYQGKIKGTIPGEKFAQMYYRYNVGENANSVVREGLLGMKR